VCFLVVYCWKPFDGGYQVNVPLGFYRGVYLVEKGGGDSAKNFIDED